MIPPLKLYRRGVLFEEIFDLIASNIREPRKTLGDLRAQVAAVTVGERRYLELVARHGAEPLAAIVTSLRANPSSNFERSRIRRNSHHGLPSSALKSWRVSGSSVSGRTDVQLSSRPGHPDGRSSRQRSYCVGFSIVWSSPGRYSIA